MLHVAMYSPIMLLYGLVMLMIYIIITIIIIIVIIIIIIICGRRAHLLLLGQCPTACGGTWPAPVWPAWATIAWCPSAQGPGVNPDPVPV